MVWFRPLLVALPEVADDDAEAVRRDVHAAVDPRVAGDALVGRCELVLRVADERPAPARVVGAEERVHAVDRGAGEERRVVVAGRRLPEADGGREGDVADPGERGAAVGRVPQARRAAHGAGVARQPEGTGVAGPGLELGP